jgi:predicted transcriptional regulator
LAEALPASRERILLLIEQEPGLHLREIPRRLHLSLRATRYHAEELAREGEITGHRDGRFLRWFPKDRYSVGERVLISLLRIGRQREILGRLLGGPRRFTELAGSVRGSPASLSRYLQTLIDLRLVGRGDDGRYRLTDPAAIRMNLTLLTPRLPDALADAARELFEETG